MEAQQESGLTTAAGAAVVIADSQTRQPVISDDEDFMVENFALGYVSCPEAYRDRFVDGWMRCHTRDQWRLIFTAYLALTTAGEFRFKRDEQAEDEGDAS